MVCASFGGHLGLIESEVIQQLKKFCVNFFLALCDLRPWTVTFDLDYLHSHYFCHWELFLKVPWLYIYIYHDRIIVRKVWQTCSQARNKWHKQACINITNMSSEAEDQTYPQWSYNWLTGQLPATNAHDIPHPAAGTAGWQPGLFRDACPSY